MRTVKTALLIGGVLVLAALVYRVGAGPILETLGRLTWWQFALVCVPYAAILTMDTLGWRFAFARDRAPFLRLMGARLVGEAVQLLTALGVVGGEATKAWLVRRDVSYEESIPSVVIAKTTTTIGQVLFLLIGVAVAAITLGMGSTLVRAMLWLLVVELAATAGFLGVQVWGLIGRTGRLLQGLGLVKDASYAQGLDSSLRRYYSSEPRRLALSVAFHFAGWLLGAGEALAMLWVLGLGAAPATAVVVEALGAGVRFATFLVPASLGAFEGANAAAFQALGFGAGAGLAFSFVRRARQAVWIAIGLVVLLVMRWRAGQEPSDAAPARPA